MATAKTPAKGLKVTSRPATFRRAGYSFSGDARVIPLADLTADEVKLITSDPNLVSQEVDLPAEAATKTEVEKPKE